MDMDWIIKNPIHDHS